METSNEDKVLFPRESISKGEILDYYESVSDRILPHLKRRPVALQRFPDGIDGPGFYQKQVGEYFPDWIPTVRVELRGEDRRQELVMCNGKAALVYLANQACLTLHPWLSREDALDRPDLLVIDVDPPDGDFGPARVGALRVRDLLRELGLVSWAKLTGSRGVHVVVPLDAEEGFDAVRGFARAAMDLLTMRHPDDLTTEQRKAERGGRVYLDVARNAYGQTAVAPWSVRALPGAPVAVPVAWGDLERGTVGPRDTTIRNAARRRARQDDPWAGFRRHARSLGPARDRLRRIGGDAGS